MVAVIVVGMMVVEIKLMVERNDIIFFVKRTNVI